jgi:quinol monooxygenase YgiN
MIREFVLLPILPEKAGEFEAIFAARRRRVLAEEPGTLKYDFFRSDQGEALYVVEEWFADEDAKAFHLANSTDHEPMMACFAGGFTVHRLTPATLSH